MGNIYKRPQVIRDLIDLASYIAVDNMEMSDRFLAAAEETFKQIVKMPKIGKVSSFSHPNLVDIRQQAIKGFKNYLVFYRCIDDDVEILRVLHGKRDIEAILDDDLREDELD